jgi:hydrogenase maturation factor
MAVASAVALLIVSPRKARRKAIGALTEYADMESSHIYGHVEATAHTRDAERVDGTARIVDESSGDEGYSSLWLNACRSSSRGAVQHIKKMN